MSGIAGSWTEMRVVVRTTLPHPCPLPLGEGEWPSDGLKWRTITAVQGRNARFFVGEISPAVASLWRGKPRPSPAGRWRIVARCLERLKTILGHDPNAHRDHRKI